MLLVSTVRCDSMLHYVALKRRTAVYRRYYRPFDIQYRRYVLGKRALTQKRLNDLCCPPLLPSPALSTLRVPSRTHSVHSDRCGACVVPSSYLPQFVSTVSKRFRAQVQAAEVLARDAVPVLPEGRDAFAAVLVGAADDPLRRGSLAASRLLDRQAQRCAAC